MLINAPSYLVVNQLGCAHRVSSNSTASGEPVGLRVQQLSGNRTHAGSPWTFSGSAGISANDSGFTSGNPSAPDGAQVAFIQCTGSFSQVVTDWAAGSYVLTFDAAQRGNLASRQDLRVLVDGIVVGSFTPTGTSYQGFSTTVFNVTAGSHTITFQGHNSPGGDNTVLVDQIALQSKCQT